jgi:hypothetical protein
VNGPVDAAIGGGVVGGVESPAPEAEGEVVGVDQPVDRGRIGSLAGHESLSVEL